MSEEEARIFNKIRDTINKIEAIEPPLGGDSDNSNQGVLRPAALRMMEWAATMSAIAYGLSLN